MNSLHGQRENQMGNPAIISYTLIYFSDKAELIYPGNSTMMILELILHILGNFS